MKIPKPVKKKTTTLREITGNSDKDVQRQLQEALTANAQLVKRNKKLRTGGSVPAVVVKPVSKKSDKKQRELEEKVAALEERERRAKLKRIRERIIAEYQGQVIPQLIVGETKADLLAAAEHSHKVWKRTLKDAGALEDEDDEDDTEDEEDDDEDEEDDEDLDTEDDEDEDDEDDEEEEPVSRRPKQRPVPTARGYTGTRAPVTTSRKPTAKVPTMPAPADRRGSGVRRGDPMTLLRTVRTKTPAQYRAERADILGNMAIAYPNEK